MTMKHVSWQDFRGDRYCSQVPVDERWIVTYESGGSGHMRTFRTTRSRDNHVEWLVATGATCITVAEC